MRSEFINEFQSYCSNIEDIVEAFRKQPQVISFAELYKCIADLSFEFVNRSAESQDIYSKIEFLFEIGFVGIFLEDEIVKSRRNLTNLIFHFSDSDSIYKGLSKDQLSRQFFVIHPIFCEWLNLRTEGRPMVLQYDWNYLRLNDDVLAVS